MAVPVEYLKRFVQTIALFIFVVQLAFALQKYFDQPLMSSPGTKTLSTLQRPIALAVCKTSQFDYAYSEDLTYMGLNNFYHGNISNSSFWSWSGPDGNMTFDETVSTLYNSSLEHVYFKLGKENVTSKFLLPNGVCRIIEGKQGRQAINFEERFDYTVTVTDPAAATHFRLSDHLMTGDKIENKKGFTSKVIVSYRVQLKETSIETGDGSCNEYPNEKHKSYADCVDDELEKKILPILGCMVPWISRKNQCAGLIPRLPIHKNLYAWLEAIILPTKAGQAYQSDTCPRPCTILSAHSIYLRSFAKSTTQKDKIQLFFDDEIKVERVVPAYDFGTLLVEIGSSLGLWLGLSVVGVFDVLVLTVDHFIKIWRCLHRYVFDRGESLNSVTNSDVADSDGVEVCIDI